MAGPDNCIDLIELSQHTTRRAGTRLDAPIDLEEDLGAFNMKRGTSRGGGEVEDEREGPGGGVS